MNENDVIAIVGQIKEEASAIEKYTHDIMHLEESESDSKVVDLFNEIRVDELEHLQKLTIELSRLLVGGKSPDGKE